MEYEDFVTSTHMRKSLLDVNVDRIVEKHRDALKKGGDAISITSDFVQDLLNLLKEYDAMIRTGTVEEDVLVGGLYECTQRVHELNWDRVASCIRYKLMQLEADEGAGEAEDNEPGPQN